MIFLALQERDNHLVYLFLILFHGSLNISAITMIPALWQHMTPVEKRTASRRGTYLNGVPAQTAVLVTSALVVCRLIG